MKKVQRAALIVFGLAVLWVMVFFAWDAYLDVQIDKQFAVSDVNSDLAEPAVTRVYIKDIGTELSALNEAMKLDTIVTVQVSYSDREDVEKQAYVVYAETDRPRYADNTYGKIILPNEWHKEEVK